jgi:endonuclease/exonuclease/phosphatase family metal-dependent hydrolase
MRELKAQYDLPWAIIGDFNEITFSHENDGGNPRPEPFMQAFRDALEDLGFSGDPFTWKRGRIRERLDRVVTNNAWNIMHPGALVKHLGYAHSDHCPILLDTEHAVMHGQQNSNSHKFEANGLRRKIFMMLFRKHGKMQV